MHRYQILIEYVGTKFVGWQKQSKGKSVQKEVENPVSNTHLRAIEPKAKIV